jgi:general secretion pathway protein K
MVHSRKGGALLAVLWMSAALAAIGFSVATTVRSEIDHASTASEGLRAQFLATGSIERAIQWMTWGSIERGPLVLYWDPAMQRFDMNYPSGDVVVELLPESSKLNINVAPPEDLTRVILAVSGDVDLAQQIAAAIVEWRSGPSPTGGSLFDDYYLGLNSPGGPTFRARHASFEEIEELLFVRGMTPELFYGNYISDSQGRLYPRGGLRDCLSVWGSLGPFDVNTASPALLEAMGLDPQQIDALMRQRTVQPLKSPLELERLGIVNPRVRVRSGSYMWTLRATARLRRPDGAPSEVVRSASAVVKRWSDPRYASMPVHVLRFYEDAWSEFALRPSSIPGAMPGALQ